MTVQTIFDFLNQRFPVDTACDFDNVGILIGEPKAEVTCVAVALDCTKAVLDFARQNACQLILTHHPVIFEPCKSVTAGSLPYELVKSGIAVISMHTNLDVGAGGVNDCLCNALALSDSQKFLCLDGFTVNTASLPRSMSADELALCIKERLGGAVKYTVTENKIQKVMLCSGSGGGYWREAYENGFDALITADVKHNVFIDAQNAGFAIFDAGHFHTEDVAVEPLARLLAQEFPELRVLTEHSYKVKTV